MNTREFTGAMTTLMRELVHGSPDPANGTFMLNRGDPGLIGSLEKLDAPAASQRVNGGGSIAAHVDHLRYGFSLMNRWAAGEHNPWKNADWTKSWHIGALDDGAWRALRSELRREADAWMSALGAPRDATDTELNWIIGSIPHLAYHVGAIRQIDRGARGPTAEDEQTHKAG